MEMRIKREVCKQIEALKDFKGGECGGILGSTDGKVIDTIEPDRPSEGDGFTYSPDVVHLNGVIARWHSTGIRFCGFFHTHLFNVNNLSEQDRIYIEEIMRTVPDRYGRLFFPVYVIPKGELVAYCAERNRNDVRIRSCPVCVVF